MKCIVKSAVINLTTISIVKCATELKRENINTDLNKCSNE